MTQTLATINDPATRNRLTASSARAFFRLAHVWELSEAQQLTLLGASISRATLNVWRNEGPKSPLTIDQLTRISYLLGIYEGLQRFFRRAPAEAERWVRRARPDDPFGGAAPLDVMLQQGIPGLAAVRQYVDGATGGPPSRTWHVMNPVHES